MEYFDESDEPGCPTCHADLHWEECDVCSGDGYFELYDEAPLYYDWDDIEECGQCEGHGGWWRCYETHEGTRCWLPSELPAASS
jgi:hypothetical protein